MSSEIVRPVRSAAWRISLWGTLAFACGSLVVFFFVYRYVANDIQRRDDTWLSGEVATLGDVAARTPKNALYGRVVREVAELASREVPDKLPNDAGRNDSVFFMQTNANGAPALWIGNGDGAPYLAAIRGSQHTGTSPFDVRVQNYKVPFLIAVVPLPDGSRVYLGLSERDELRVLRNLRARFLWLWLLNVLMGFALIFYSTRRVLRHIGDITLAASRIGESDLSKRVPTSRWNDEVSQLASTLNHMLDRIERSVYQLHTITNSLAHDLRSPLTAVRAKLEMSLTHSAANGTRSEDGEAIESAIDEIDRLTEILNQSLDVAEAEAGALRLERTGIHLDEVLRVLIDLYEPCMSDKGLSLRLQSGGPVEVWADAALLHRMLANLFDNELKHLPACSTIAISLSVMANFAVLVIEDDGLGFDAEIAGSVFQPQVKGRTSEGRGLGLAFVEAVVMAHGGTVSAVNRDEGGARLTVSLPVASEASRARVSSELGDVVRV